VTEIDPKRHQFDSVASEKRRKRPREWHCFVPPGRRAWAKEDFQKIIFRARIDSPSPLRRSNLNPNPFSPTSVRSGSPVNLTHSMLRAGNRKTRRNAARRSARTTSRLSVLSLEERVVPTSSLPVQLTSSAGVQVYRAAGADGAGNFVVLYDSQASSGAADSMVYAQQLDATGQPTGSPIAVNTDTTGSHIADGIAVNADGSFVAVWSGAGPGGE
jgi:hypothetical protein